MGIQMPDVPEHREERRVRPVAAVLVAALVVVGMLAVGLISSGPEEEGFSEPTEPELEAVAGPELEWKNSEVGPAGDPIAFVERGPAMYLFVSGGGEQEPSQPRGLSAYVSLDGRTWDPSGMLIPPPNRIDTVVDTPLGLVAAGADGHGAMAIWTSEDTTAWERQLLPSDGSADPAETSVALAIGGTDWTTAVFGLTYFDPDEVAMANLPAELDGWPRSRLDAIWSSDGSDVAVVGPLGITVYVAPGSEFGLDSDQPGLLPSPRYQSVRVWAASADGTWSVSELELNYVSSVYETAGGDLAAVGYGWSGAPQIWTTPDGEQWASEGYTGGIEQPVVWGDLFVGARQGPASQILSYSKNGLNWDPLGVGALLPESAFWWYQHLTAGEGGVAAAATGYSGGFDTSPRLTLEKDGYLLADEWETGSLVLSRAGKELVRVPTYRPRLSENLDIDLATGTVTFLGPETSKPLVTFTFDELEEAENTRDEAISPSERHLLLFSADGRSWSVSGLADLTEVGTWVDLLHVSRDRVYVAVQDRPPSPLGRPLTGQLEILSAPIPPAG